MYQRTSLLPQEQGGGGWGVCAHINTCFPLSLSNLGTLVSTQASLLCASLAPRWVWMEVPVRAERTVGPRDLWLLSSWDRE